ncbi:MAG: hypothetical protein FJ220_07765 [Kiritimatiellaceae bacterium]|nr:hypothetical protein [Kiritimatiellaceae bacterium]
MLIKFWITHVLVCLLALTASAKTDDPVSLFTNHTGDNDWTNPQNWEDQTLPGTNHIARLGRSAIARITTNMTVGALQNGVNASSSVIMDGGTITTTSRSLYNSASYNQSGSSLTILNGGQLYIESYFIVGVRGTPGGSVSISNGTLFVKGVYAHNRDFSEPAARNTRTTVHPDGTLNVGSLDLNAGVLDISGGTVIVRQDNRYQLQEWIENGRIVAMGGVDGWKIKIGYNEETAETLLTVEECEIILGKMDGRLTLNPQFVM